MDRGTSPGGVPTTLNTAPNYTLPVVTAARAANLRAASAATVMNGTSALCVFNDCALTIGFIDFGDGSDPATVPVACGSCHQNGAKRR